LPALAASKFTAETVAKRRVARSHGRVEQTNFDSYQILRMNEVPAVESLQNSEQSVCNAWIEMGVSWLRIAPHRGLRGFKG
jgi:hypothetical protein